MNLEQAIQATDDLMVSVVNSDVPILSDASRHIIAAGGKRVRPRLLFLAFQISGGVDLIRAIPVAAAIEIVHTATLVHDDINDHGRVRRGRVTVNEKWGRTFALLTGDFLFTKVYELMAPYRDLNVTFAQATLALVEGETLQAYAAKTNTLNRESYQQIVAKKTASLFRAAALLGAQLAEAPQKECDALGEYGFYLGLAFQIVDDLLDLTGDPRLMGKESKVDIAQGKGVATAYASGAYGPLSAPTLIADVVEEPNGDPFLAVKRRLIEGGAVDEGRHMVAVIAAQARATLAHFPESDALRQLHVLLDEIVRRDR